MTIIRSSALFVVAALAEVGGAWLIWQGVREHRGLLWIGAGVAALGAYGFVATLQPDANFGRVLAAYGGIFVAGSLGWGVLVDKFRPDNYDLVGAAICLLGVAVILYAPRYLAQHRLTRKVSHPSRSLSAQGIDMEMREADRNGGSQRAIAARTGQSQSEASEIIAGRRQVPRHALLAAWPGEPRLIERLLGRASTDVSPPPAGVGHPRSRGSDTS